MSERPGSLRLRRVSVAARELTGGGDGTSSQQVDMTTKLEVEVKGSCVRVENVSGTADTTFSAAIQRG